MMSEKIVVAGNGISRKHFDFKDFTVVGCNAICRDYKVDYLVACDKRMVKEALAHKVNPIYTRERWRKAFNDDSLYDVPDLPYKGHNRQDEPMHWGSGPYAVLLGATLSDHIYLVGFDLYKGNIYRATSNYNDKDVDPSYWIYQLARLFDVYKEKKFTILNTKDWILPKEWDLPNVEVDKQTFYKYNTKHVYEDF